MQSQASDCESIRVAGPSSLSFVRAPFAGASLIRASLILLVAGGATLLLAGCGPRRVRADFTNYESAYAVTSNRELLLNLARLEQHDPTYFFKLGQISSSYRMQATLTGTGALTAQGTVPGGSLPTGSGTPGFIYENDPSFSFVPVNDQANATLLLQPVPENVFYSLFQQGWRIDQLFRLMVDRIEVTLPPDPSSTTDKGCRVEVIRNVPPASIDGPDFAQSARDLDRYVTFLRVSAVVYALQKHGLLLLRGTNNFGPIDKASFIPNNAIEGGDTASKSSSLPTAKDFNDAAAKSQEWELQDADARGKGGKWVLGQKTLVPKFQLNTMVPDASESVDQIYGQSVKTVEDSLRNDLLPNDPSVSELTNAPELTDTLEVLFSGFAIGGSATDQDTGKGPCTSSGHGIVTSHLVLRSIIGLMAAAAQEQAFYDALAKSGKDPEIRMDKDDLVTRIHVGLLIAQQIKPDHDDPDYLKRAAAVAGKTFSFSQLVPAIERLPVLRLTWPGEVKPPVGHSASSAKEIGLAVNYKGKEYVVADVDSEGVNPAEYALENETWNRDMFRLINQLSSQVTVDTSKYQQQEILQLRTN
ncbi:MAG: hypothetical protein P4K93_06305 [Terracidiphilus sp.]|nr:hypothetical protein [Terracidiphilus sp.]